MSNMGSIWAFDQWAQGSDDFRGRGAGQTQIVDTRLRVGVTRPGRAGEAGEIPCLPYQRGARRKGNLT